MEGSGPEVAEFHALNARIATADRVADVINGSADAPIIETTFGSQLNTSKLMDAVAGLRDLGWNDDAISAVIKGNETVPAEVHEYAKQWKRDAMSDEQWVRAYLGGDAVARRQMASANAIINTTVKENK
jgi:hypothetical protein